MTSYGAIHDPLTINLPRQIGTLKTLIPTPSNRITDLVNTSSNVERLAILSKLIVEPAFTLTIAALFRPILFDLCARWLEDEENTEEQLVALCLLLEVHEELFPILNQLLSRAMFSDGPLGFINTTPSPLSLDTPRLHRLLLAYYRILRANRELPRFLFWPLSPLSILTWTPHLDNGVRLLAIRCYALQSGMGEAERETIEREVLRDGCGVDCQLEFGRNIDGSRREVDGWVMPVIEIERIKGMREEIALKQQDYYNIDETEVSLPISLSELSPMVANIHGVFLLRAPGSTKVPSSPLIPTPTAVQGLQSLAFHLSLRLPTLITSPPSSGKSLFLSHLAETLHPDAQNQIITIHLADTSLDPRSLLGSYVSSPTQPGTFEWKEGVLVRSMREGKWVVFEEIDRGSNEVLGVIKPLVESLRLGKWIGGRASLQVPSRGRVVAHDSFALFATRSMLPSRTGAFAPPVFFGAHKFYEVLIPSPSPEELKTVLNMRFPHLVGSAAVALIHLWEAVKSLGAAASTRDIGLRELEKFCVRVQRLLPSSHQPMDIDSDDPNEHPSLSVLFPNPTLREDIFLEARDVFFGAGALTTAARTYLEMIAATIAEHLGLEADRRDWLLRGRTPDFDLEKDVNGNVLAVRIGRSRLPAKATVPEMLPPAVRPFAMHKPAVSLLSRIATAVLLSEPVLLTGETGTGKTSIVTHLASTLRRPLISLNLSHQTESSDLLGGFKPVDARMPGSVLQQRFLDLFGGTFSRRKNEKFETEVRKAVGEGKWKRAVGLWKESSRLARDRIRTRLGEETRDDTTRNLDLEIPRKRRKVDSATLNVSEASWISFVRDVEEFEVQHVQGKGKFAFGFVEGPLVKALRSGDWVLLDEINLASPETLECISGLLHGPTASITLTEQGSLEPVPRHPNFRLFACMNPATDVGKKDLPPNIRSRFTEIDVPPPDADKETLLSIVTQYIGASAVGDKGAIMNVAEFYAAVKDLAEKRQIADGSNHRPHYSMRTLARALTFASDTASSFGLRRAIWEGCLMAFTMVLDADSASLVTSLAHKHLLTGVRNPRSMLTKEPSVPYSRTAEEFIKLGPFYLERGPLPEDPMEDYIMTPSVETKLIDLARIILTRRFPILIEGPTSSGKTSSVEYLARRTGHRFIRINNHEHTDIQEYIGSYVSDALTGKLVFKDGLLVRALRNGDWIVLDELNLAPTDVLEALNRLLDDNRELVIPETQEVVKPHPNFMLFATQNPPGLYAGRKVLSRAFRNRFLEVHFEDVPQAELEAILCQRCRIAPSYGKRIVNVFHELQKRRQSSRVFESKQGFATLRDLFRWAGRDAVGYQELADNGYMLLAERARRDDDKAAVKEIIESVMNVKIDEKAMYNMSNSGVDSASFLGCLLPTSSNVIWTRAMRRLFTLVARALRFNEPVLLVGETGSGKTSVCQVFAEACSQRLHGLNCHQNTETADLIGGLRPMRNRSTNEAEVFREASELLHEIGVPDVPPSFDALVAAFNVVLKHTSTIPPQHLLRVQAVHNRLLRLQSIFEWRDGPLVEAMRNGDIFLLDEISLADDSVLERLNSVLEPSRTIVLAERGGDDLEYPAIQATSAFKLVATMNPGGDYGKKELSPALRNRFTEIWVPRVEDRHDLELIVSNSWKYENLKSYTPRVLDFAEWLCIRVGDHSLMSLRDILAWVVFTNSAYQPENPNSIPPTEIFHHAAHMTFLDGLGSLPQLSAYTQDALQRLKDEALSKLMDLVPLADRDNLFSFVPAHNPATSIQFGSFAIPKGPSNMVDHTFNLHAPTTRDNAMRVVRACQVSKPILLEGSPGVGKTSLITALANISGHKLCRINLSDQTDLIDLFGSDLPVEGGGPGEFAWKDAEFLTALQQGHWVLLDEMNLAPQAVLEGLNAVLDHRGTVYIPELGRSFVRHPSFRIFAAQNPLNQGGGRKGLPKSFVNRFTKVYIEELSPSDLLVVCQHIFPDFDEAIVRAMISFNMHLSDDVSVQRRFAREGSPWEFNLRDVIRWGTLLQSPSCSSRPRHPAQYLRTAYLQRFRTAQDQEQARLLFDKVFSTSTASINAAPNVNISSSNVQVGHFIMQRKNMVPLSPAGRILKMHLSVFESLGHCVSHTWLAILTGQRNSGKTDAVRVLAHYTGNTLQEISVNSATDTMDILGSFEQADLRGRALAAVDDVLDLLETHLRSSPGSKKCHDHAHTLQKARHRSTPTDSLLRLALSVVTDFQDLLPPGKGLGNMINGLLSAIDSVGRFEWVDGPLVQAMKHGHWLLMDGANLCSPSVLDRLNSLCEPDGFLTLSERGYVDGKVQVLKPHPNFRLFMTVDPQYGELSRAMRNRGIEIALMATPISDDPIVLSDFERLPSTVSKFNTKSRCLAFDAARRGLLLQPSNGSVLVSSSGRALDQDSGLSSLLDQAPMVILSSLKSTGASDAHLFFVARTFAPAYIGHFSRYLGSPSEVPGLSHIQALFKVFPSQSLTGRLAHVRRAYSLSWGLPSDHIITQPMDLYLTTPPGVDRSLEAHTRPAHYGLLQVLDLSVALFLDQEDKNRTSIPEVETHAEKHNGRSRALKEITSVLTAIYSTAYQILESISPDDWASKSEETRLACTLLGYGRHLRVVLANTTFDFSAVQAISRWVADALEKCPPSFFPVAAQYQALNDAISLSRGLGLVEIWSSLYAGRQEMIPTFGLGDLENLASRLTGKDARTLRRQVFDLLSLQTIPTGSSSQSTEILSKLKTDLELHLSKHNPDGTKQNSRIEPFLLIGQLGGLGRMNNIEALSQCMEEIIDTACGANSPLHRLVPHQHLVWVVNAGKTPAPAIARSLLQWLDNLWSAPSSNEPSSGPTILLQPTQLNSILESSDWSRKSLDSLETHGIELNQHSRLALLQCKQNSPRIDQLRSLLRHSISLIAACFSSSSLDTEPLHCLASNPMVGMATEMKQAISYLEKSNNHHFKSSVNTILRPLLQCLQDTGTRERTIVDLGLCWVAMGALIIDLFVPDAPVDPAAIQNCTAERWGREQDMLVLQLSLHKSLEQFTTGNSTNDIVNHLKENVDVISAHIANMPSVPVRKDVPRLHMFWSEVLQFQMQIIPPTKNDALIKLLQTGDDNALLREQVVQQSMAGFCQRLDTVYNEYTDLSLPLQLAIHHMRMGLRLVAQSSVHISESGSKLASALVAFPSVRSSAAVRADSAAGPTGISAFRHILLTLSAIATEKLLGVDVEGDTLELVYGQALRLWLIDRAKEHEMDEASQSLYRHKNLDHDALGEAEIEEREFLALFPSFEDALEPRTQKSTQQQDTSPLLIQPTEKHQLLAIHNGLFDPSGDTAGGVSFKDLRVAALESLMESQLRFLPDTLDNESLALQLSLLHDRSSRLQTDSDTRGESYNFYFDANVQQVKKAIIVIDALRSRLDVLIQEWPDQMVLHHLRSRCDIILGLDLHSPVAKVLSALEQLLLHTEDWEIYSNRDNTLKSYQQGLIVLIVEWRRLELSCWQVLLDSQAKTFSEGVSDWWFRLYDVVVRGPLDVCDREADDSSSSLTEYLDTLIPLLDDFIRSSPLGQFHARMSLLRSFELYLHHLHRRRPDRQRPALERVQRVLHATLCYYDLYSTKLSAHLTSEKALLEKEIRGFIKLASWRDINVQALKQSAQRTHHQLYKIIRKFRDVLRQPISERLQPQLADGEEAKPLQEDAAPLELLVPLQEIPDGDSVTSSTHLFNLNKTFLKFNSLITTRIRPCIRSRSPHTVDDLAVDIIIITKKLSEISHDIPAEKRGKQQKSLLVRKRKAWSDLLKELKHAGFAANVKPEVLREHTDVRWLREQPIMPVMTQLGLSTTKGENYFARLSGSLPQLRSSVSNHHSDLTTRELQRGIMFLESSYSMSLKLRARLADALTRYHKLEKISVRLKMLSSSTRLIVSGLNLLEHVSSLRDLLCRLTDALQEILQGIRTLNALQPKVEVSKTFVNDVTSFALSTSVLRDHCKKLHQNLSLTSFPILSEDENELISRVVQQLSQTSTTLHRWSEAQPGLLHLLHPVEQWFNAQHIPHSLHSISRDAPRSNIIDTFLNSLLLTVQSLISKCPESKAEEAEPDEPGDDNYILRNYRSVREFTHLLNMDAILTSLDDGLVHLAAHGGALQKDLQRMLPFLDSYIALVKDQLATHNQWTKALFKLNYVLCSIMHTLSTQGFCKPSDDNEAETGGETTETTEGVGLGDGSGTQNVSKDIEDESQVEGLQGDDAEDQGPTDKDDDTDAIEMSEEFDGKMEDIPDTGSEDDADSDHESDVDPEEKLGDLDTSDPSAVDEKLWGDEEGPKDDSVDEQIGQDHSEEKSGKSEVAAKERKDQSKSKEKPEETGEEITSDNEDHPMPEEADEGDDDPNASGAPMDDYVQDANTLDLPDDMNLGDDVDMGEADLPDDMDADGEELMDDLVEDKPSESFPDEGTDEQAQEEPIAEDPPAPTSDQETDMPNQAQEENDEDTTLEDDESNEQAIAQPDISSGEGATSADEAYNPNGGESASTGQAGNSEGAVGKEAASFDKATNANSMLEPNLPQTESQTTDSHAPGSAAVGSQEGQAPSQSDSKLSTNPLRSLGDALKEIRQRFDDILGGEQRDEPLERSGDVGAVSQMEYLRPDDADHDMQALGPAGEDQVAKLNELKLIDEDDKAGDAAPMDISLPLEQEGHEQPPALDQASQLQSSSVEQRNDIEGAILRSAHPAINLQNVSPDPLQIKADVEMEDDAEQTAELQLRDWQSQGFPDAGAEHIWRLYESLTHDLAYALCEQLRLILEPTLATRLKGDYRTGKRLNMKKIISYIASDYTKDKIWLRRTRPSQREYQVLIAIDDSRSMAESHSVHLAYETLALVSKALNRLEAGDIGIAKFGETVDILHGFDEGPFTDQVGARVMNSFRFNQRATNVLSLVDTSLKVLETARERRSMASATAADLWQLEIIISDGMCQDHDLLRTVLRRAEEQRVMIVFIIIDSLHSTTNNAPHANTSSHGAAQGSILSMDKAEFKNVDGRMELQLKKYLDSFPFEYYVVLRSVEALPEVLAGTLKQFFERISEE